MVYNKPWGKTDKARDKKYKKDALKKIKSKLTPKKKKSEKKSANKNSPVAKNDSKASVKEEVVVPEKRKVFGERKAEKFIVGNNYIVPTFGPMRCEGIQSIHLADFGEQRTISFTSVFNKASGTIRIPVRRIGEYDIRPMATSKELDSMMAVLSSKLKIRARLPSKAGARMMYFDDVLERGDLTEMAQLARKVYADFEKSTNGRQGIGTVDEHFLKKAIPTMAFQYATGKEMDLDFVTRMIEQKAGKPSLASLSEPPRGRARAP